MKIGLMKIITEFVTLRPKTYSFLTNDGKEDKKAKGTKKCIKKRRLNSVITRNACLMTN